MFSFFENKSHPLASRKTFYLRLLITLGLVLFFISLALLAGTAG